MQNQHREAIQRNFSSLVEQTDLDLMVSALYEKGVFSEMMIEPYKDTSRDTRMRKRKLYMDITTRGPSAFRNLLDALSENGYWDLVRALDPTSSLHMRPPVDHRIIQNSSGENFLSISEKKKTVSGREQNDPNRNRGGESGSGAVARQNKSTAYKGAAESASAHPDPDPPATPSSDIPHFNVTKSTRFFEDNGSDIKLYRTRGRLRGVLLLFSYIEFKHCIEEERRGARVDADNLRYLFSELGFKVLSYLDLSLQATTEVLGGLRHSLCAESEAVFVVFSSHGYARPGSGDADIRCSDGQLISFYHIIRYFNNVHFPALRNKPKVFIFQTCRGSNKDSVGPPQRLPEPSHDGGGGGAPAPECDGRPDDPATTHDADRVYSDILIAHSTVPGYVSHRDARLGSWYIQALCDVFAARAHDCHVEDLFTLVDERLRRRFATQTSSVDRWGFNRRLYLHPGLYED